jgi:hypothetical protein
MECSADVSFHWCERGKGLHILREHLSKCSFHTSKSKFAHIQQIKNKIFSKNLVEIEVREFRASVASQLITTNKKQEKSGEGGRALTEIQNKRWSY